MEPTSHTVSISNVRSSFKNKRPVSTIKRAA